MTTPSAAIDLPIDAHSAVLLVFHDHEWEQAVLMQAAQQRPVIYWRFGEPQNTCHAGRAAQAGGAERGTVRSGPRANWLGAIAAQCLADCRVSAGGNHGKIAAVSDPLDLIVTSRWRGLADLRGRACVL